MMPEASDLKFAAALIAGGRSQRMGRDKAWLEWRGKPLWRVQLGKLAALCPEALLVSCRVEQQLDEADAVMLYDPPENQGPLPALARCLEHARTSVFALAVDMPEVTIDLMRTLMEMSGTSGTGAVCQASHGYEPLCALYPYAVLPLLQQSLAQGNLRVQSFVEEAVAEGLLQVMPLSQEQEALFLNLNSPADLP